MKSQIMSYAHATETGEAGQPGAAHTNRGQVEQTQAPIADLVAVLRDELAAHHTLLQLELSKREAIISRNGELLKQAASEQANQLVKIDLLESRRDMLARRFVKNTPTGDIRLSNVIESVEVSAPVKKELNRYQGALKAALEELKKLSDVNARMLIDSRDLFREMLASLAGKNATHMGARTRPVLVDANC